ncbi:DUF4279 domain-containing protein [Gottfriedia acidiceleris]|uniref:DUF4279 domain-containing protein n=1 Tax=Gottfriedia acidiceleris TaxID=371036 RepID=UPI00143218EF|nr:DUF4279 domain-containing protein [Gottfriedia acidiceleris]
MMITEMDITCHLYGDNFSPNKVEQLTGLTLMNKIEVGDIRTKGVYKDKASPYGDCVLYPPEKHKQTDDYGLLWLAENLSKHLELIKNCGAENIDLVIGVFYDGQCNFVLDPKAINIIGGLGIPLQISCYDSY